LESEGKESDSEICKWVLQRNKLGEFKERKVGARKWSKVVNGGCRPYYNTQLTVRIMNDGGGGKGHSMNE